MKERLFDRIRSCLLVGLLSSLAPMAVVGAPAKKAVKKPLPTAGQARKNTLPAPAHTPAKKTLSRETWGTSKAVGFHYPGFSARYNVKHVALEGIYLQQGGAKAFGPRLYINLNPGS